MITIVLWLACFAYAGRAASESSKAFLPTRTLPKPVGHVSTGLSARTSSSELPGAVARLEKENGEMMWELERVRSQIEMMDRPVIDAEGSQYGKQQFGFGLLAGFTLAAAIGWYGIKNASQVTMRHSDVSMQMSEEPRRVPSVNMGLTLAPPRPEVSSTPDLQTNTSTNGTKRGGYFLPPSIDLTPAVDKFPRLPFSLDADSEMPMKADGPAPEGPDPFKLVDKELQPLSKYVMDLVESENPVLTMAASHFFDQKQGKRFRPTIVALVGRALSGDAWENERLYQLQLGQITEMIHVASLIHDDVLDGADMRRGGDAVHTMYSNKVAVLAGDYLLARASVLLGRLQNVQVVEVMASALDSLVQGEIMQARAKKKDLLNVEQYLRKSYFKTGSLISNSCKSTALLAGYVENDEVTVAAEKYGYHLGMAYQIVDDILDFTGASATLGKPAQADMELGLSTAPILYASEQEPSLRPLIERRFKNDGDIQKAVAVAKETDCVQKSYRLAEFHVKMALDALMKFPESESRQALQKLLHLVLSRSS